MDGCGGSCGRLQLRIRVRESVSFMPVIRVALELGSGLGQALGLGFGQCPGKI